MDPLEYLRKQRSLGGRVHLHRSTTARWLTSRAGGPLFRVRGLDRRLTIAGWPRPRGVTLRFQGA
jgi:hypothetical protein